MAEEPHAARKKELLVSVDRVRFLVTAAGSGPGAAVIRAIKMIAPDAYVVAVDANPHSAGLYLADAWSLVPTADDEHYVQALVTIAARHGVELIIPIMDVELPRIVADQHAFERSGTLVAANPLSSIVLATSKIRSTKACLDAGISVPETWDPGLGPAPFSLYGRPDHGLGTRGNIRVATGEAIPQVEQFLWQRELQGREFSIDLWCGGGTQWFVAVPRERLAVRSGQSVKGKVIADRSLVEFARRVANVHEFTDVACIQIIEESETKELFFIEANPRYGTGVSLSVAAGVRFPELQYLARFEPERIVSEMLEFRDGLMMLRYWNEIFLDG
jgi:carbamoyl-phosphate synthase large subunit